MKNRLLFSLAVTAFAACNNLSEQKKVQQDKADDTTQAATPASAENRATFSKDTTIGEYRIAVLTRGDATMRNLVIGVGPKKDSTRADTLIEKDIKGNVSNISVADLDNDGHPELYVFSISAGTEMNGKVYGFVIAGKGAVRINTAALDTLQEKDYKGRDSFYINGKDFIRTYPAYREGQPDALTADTRRIIHYQLRKTTNGYLLEQTSK